MHDFWNHVFIFFLFLNAPVVVACSINYSTVPRKSNSVIYEGGAYGVKVNSPEGAFPKYGDGYALHSVCFTTSKR